MKALGVFLFIVLSFRGFVCADDYDFPDAYPAVYEKLNVLPVNRHGWATHYIQLNPFFATGKIRTVIEVGCWLGNWTIFAGQSLPEDGKIFAVDHWKGSTEHYNVGSYESTLLPTLFQQFLSNIVHFNLTKKVVPVRMHSLLAAKKFEDLKIKADLIYIDAAHDYTSVLKDIEAWFPMLNERGIMCGDDWNLGGVAPAVIDFASKHGLKVCVDNVFWWYEVQK